MVLHIILSLLDLLTAIILLSHVSLGMFSNEVILYNAAYLVIKGLLFIRTDFASKIDLLAGIYMVLIGLNLFSNQVLTIGVVIWLAQKTVLIIGGFISNLFF